MANHKESKYIHRVRYNYGFILNRGDMKRLSFVYSNRACKTAGARIATILRIKPNSVHTPVLQCIISVEL